MKVKQQYSSGQRCLFYGNDCSSWDIRDEILFSVCWLHRGSDNGSLP